MPTPTTIIYTNPTTNIEFFHTAPISPHLLGFFHAQAGWRWSSTLSFLGNRRIRKGPATSYRQ